jgi:mono/diheme cytochrome c family protein
MNRLLVRGVKGIFFVFAGLLMMATSARAQGDAAKNYTAKCATCHGADGSAGTTAGKALKARDFHSADVAGETDAVLEQVIAKGKNKMPAYEKQLKPEEIKDLVAYCRQLGKK